MDDWVCLSGCINAGPKSVSAGNGQLLSCAMGTTPNANQLPLLRL